MTVNHESWTTDDSEWYWTLENANNFAELMINVSYCCLSTTQLLTLTTADVDQMFVMHNILLVV